MKPCQNCQTVIDEYLLDKQLEPLRDLTVDDFSVCADCTTIVADACVKCGGAVYVPRSGSVIPDYLNQGESPAVYGGRESDTPRRKPRPMLTLGYPL